MKTILNAFARTIAVASMSNAVHAQEHDHGQMSHGDMSGMDMPASNKEGISDIKPEPAFAEGSGTSRLPGKEGAMQGLHLMTDGWMLMAHGQAQANYTDHGGLRGDDKLYVTSMAMLSASKNFGGARLALKSMFSLERS